MHTLCWLCVCVCVCVCSYIPVRSISPRVENRPRSHSSIRNAAASLLSNQQGIMMLAWTRRCIMNECGVNNYTTHSAAWSTTLNPFTQKEEEKWCRGCNVKGFGGEGTKQQEDNETGERWGRVGEIIYLLNLSGKKREGEQNRHFTRSGPSGRMMSSILQKHESIRFACGLMRPDQTWTHLAPSAASRWTRTLLGVWWLA